MGMVVSYPKTSRMMRVEELYGRAPPWAWPCEAGWEKMMLEQVCPWFWREAPTPYILILGHISRSF